MVTSVKLSKVIIEGIQDKKGEEILKLDLRKIENTVCDFFIICHADSKIQLQTISDYIVRTVKDKAKEHVWHKEGHENAQWILLDYVNVVVHIFESKARQFYDIENLWADAKTTKIKN